MSFLTIYTSSGVFDRMMIFFSSISHLYRLFRFLFLSFNLYQFHFFSFLISRIDKSNFPNYTHNIMYSIAYIVSSCIHTWRRAQRIGEEDDNGKNLYTYTPSVFPLSKIKECELLNKVILLNLIFQLCQPCISSTALLESGNHPFK